MASAFGHAALAIGAGKLFHPVNTTKLITIGVICSILPDIDVLAFRWGIPYEHWLGHRGFTHSIGFALGLSLLITTLCFRAASRKATLLIFLYIFFCTISHAILDGMTTGGRGVGYFIPFDNERYFLPWRMIRVSPLGIQNFFSSWGMRVIQSELVWIGIPSLALWIIGYLSNRHKKTHKAL